MAFSVSSERNRVTQDLLRATFLHFNWTLSCGSPAVFYAETRPPVLWTGKTKCGRVLICVDGSGRVKKILMYHSLQYIGLLRALYRALYTSCYCHILYRHMCISWASTRHLPSPRVFARFREGRAHVLRQATFWSCINTAGRPRSWPVMPLC